MSINFLKQAGATGYYWNSPLNTPDYQSGANMRFRSLASTITGGGSFNATPWHAINLQTDDKSYIIQNLTVTNLSDADYNSINVSTLVNYQSNNTSFITGYVRDIINQRLIGPRQTAQLISKDSSLVFGRQGDDMVYEGTYGRYCSLSFQHSGSTTLQFYVAYIEITWQND